MMKVHQNPDDQDDAYSAVIQLFSHQVSEMVVGFDGSRLGDTAVVITNPVHREHVVDGLPDAVPLCWWAEGLQRREPATIEDWLISFDQEVLPSWAGTTDEPSCRECRELVHA